MKKRFLVVCCFPLIIVGFALLSANTDSLTPKSGHMEEGKKMKRVLSLIMALTIVLSLAACGSIKKDLEINFGETRKIEDANLDSYENLLWASDDESIVKVDNRNVIGNAPGTAKITATNDEKTVAEYKITVKLIPITGIVLATDEKTIKVDETFKIDYTLFPENASNYGLSWKSADNTVASVDSEGYVTGVSEGQTSVTLYNDEGLMTTCKIVVEPKSAYEQLSEKEKSFVDLCLQKLGKFKNPDSIVIKGLYNRGKDEWTVKISAQNSFGGNTTEVYFLDKGLGFYNYKMAGIDKKLTIKPDSSFNIDLINDAIKEKR